MLYHTRKVEINLGYACNAKCPFCYYYDSVITRTNENTLTTEQARAQLMKARKLGIEEIEFTGGEVTLRKDLPELITYAKKNLGFSVVCLITNGIRLSRRDYVQSLVAAGVDDILFSIHGHDAATHDELTKVPGSFAKILQAIAHAHEYGLRVRTNTVVCKTNFMHMTEIMQLLIRKKVDNINLVMFNPVLQAKNIDIVKDVYVSYADAGREIINAIRVCESDLPHFNVRYMPFCFLPGYERYVTNMDQMTFDPDEWDNFASFRIRKGGLVTWIGLILGIPRIPYLRFVARYGLKAVLTAGLSRFYVLKDRIKTRHCRECAYENVCDYLYRHYLDIYGDAGVVPINGQKVVNPAWAMNAAHFRKPGQLPEKINLAGHEPRRITIPVRAAGAVNRASPADPKAQCVGCAKTG
jgi:MoaA/NifB/PqqE/SkfB family radical SAM enzyme